MPMKLVSQGLMASLLASVLWVSPARAQTESTLERLPVLGASLEQIEAYRRNLHRWDRLVRGFRRDHSLTVQAGTSRGTWRIRGPHEAAEREVATLGTNLTFQYTFHIPLAKSFGYYLGSAFGEVFEERSHDTRFHIYRTLELPGVLAGFVLNFTPAFRSTVGLDAGMARVERLAVPDASTGQDQMINVTTRYLAGVGALEFFFDLRWALRLEGAYRRTFYTPPLNLGKDSVLKSSLGKAEQRYGIGIVHHLL